MSAHPYPARMLVDKTKIAERMIAYAFNPFRTNMRIQKWLQEDKWIGKKTPIGMSLTVILNQSIPG